MTSRNRQGDEKHSSQRRREGNRTPPPEEEATLTMAGHPDVDGPNPTTVAGCVFVQRDTYLSIGVADTDSPTRSGDTYGVASYHFDDLASPYISYENAPPTWALSDGTPLPRRKPFLAPAYDAETRTFRGEVVWEPPTNDGQARWVYRMVFSETFGAIEGGEVEMFGPDGARLDTRRFGQDLFYRRMVHEREQMKAFIEYRVRRSRVSDASDDGT